ncbi:Aste57867_696 [Aphanomyces stellatus]|uniref:Aste57867_696 protein n=1 Tax=Aphanomyces stellatus TaxID=120398 RepID=A0A485K4F7_9STRA|nr:hypothetical protein As57867_000695 [Aphanomyces stellatus]VFT77920.1 Aste57867_696 [Aphanomyces stellatus]
MDNGGDGPGLWFWRVLGILMLVALSALFAGLTLGLMSLDKVGLEVVIGAGEDDHATEKEKAQAAAAKRIAPIRRDGNLLLTTLLLGNVAVNSLLSIIMADITSGALGFVVSTVIIVLFGEIIPQAVCSRHALAIGAKSIPIVKVIIACFYVFAKPVSVVLDRMLGQEVGTIFTKKELWKMLDIHVKQEMIDDEESWIMYGALHYKGQKVSAIMTPIDKVFMLPATARLGADTIREIYQSGFSRIPVWHKTRNDIVGLLFVKDLVFIDPEDAVPVVEFIHIFGRGVHRVWPDANLGDLLRAFKMGRSRLALVQDVNNKGAGDPYLEAIGIVTLEDVVEEILQDTFRNEGEVSGEKTRKATAAVNRRVDYGKMRLLGLAPEDDERFLTMDEARDLARYLIDTQPVFQLLKPGDVALTPADVCAMLVQCPLVSYGKETSNGSQLYSKAQVAIHCSIVMDGSVDVSSSGLASDRGLWTVLAPECLVAPENAFVPDFSATVHGAKVLCLQISRVEFQQMLRPINLAVRTNHSGHLSRRHSSSGSPVRRFQLPLPPISVEVHPLPTASSSSLEREDVDPNEVTKGLLAGDSLVE